MDFDEQYEAERRHIRHRQQQQPVEKWIGDLKQRGFPHDGWMKAGRHEYRGGIRSICSACGYPGLYHAVVITHIEEELTIVVGPHCAGNATG